MTPTNKKAAAAFVVLVGILLGGTAWHGATRIETESALQIPEPPILQTEKVVEKIEEKENFDIEFIAPRHGATYIFGDSVEFTWKLPAWHEGKELNQDVLLYASNDYTQGYRLTLPPGIANRTITKGCGDACLVNSFSWKAPDDLAPGTYYLWLYVTDNNLKRSYAAVSGIFSLSE